MKWLFPALLFSLSPAWTQPQPSEAAKLTAAGERHIEAGQLSAARSAFERALQLDPSLFPALSGLGFVDYSEGRLEQAKAALQKAAAMRPSSFQTRFLLGATLVELNDTKSAIRELRAAHALDPGHLDTRKLLAVQYSQSRRFKEAIALVEPVLDARPYDEEAHLLLLDARQTSGDAAGAYALALKAAQRFPSSARVASWLGFQLDFAGRYDEAKDYFRKAIRLDPSFPAPYQLLAGVFLKEENYTEAVAWYRRADERAPEDVETLLGLSKALLASGQTGESLTVLQNASRIDPGHARVHLQLSRLHFLMGNEALAQQEAELALKLKKSEPGIPQTPAALRMGH